MKMLLKFTIVYVASIVLVNYGFSVVPLVPLPGGEMWPPMSLIVGLVFVARDFAQREIGHKVLLAMLLGCGLSYLMADPFVAIASVVAFGISEMVDWLVYTYTGRPFAQRVLMSSVVGTPVDSAVFLAMIEHFSWTGVAVMTASKMLGALAVWYGLRRRAAA
jgi:uncharacterized PurR-regulated membrane protein YhhQ (DUF165 family)